MKGVDPLHGQLRWGWLWVYCFLSFGGLSYAIHEFINPVIGALLGWNSLPADWIALIVFSAVLCPIMPFATYWPIQSAKTKFTSWGVTQPTLFGPKKEIPWTNVQKIWARLLGVHIEGASKSFM